MEAKILTKSFKLPYFFFCVLQAFFIHAS